MANAVNVNFRMDPDLKRNMEEVCAEMGLSMTTAFTIFAKKVSREHRIPFEVSADPFYSESNINSDTDHFIPPLYYSMLLRATDFFALVTSF